MSVKTAASKTKQWVTLTRLWQQPAHDWVDFLKGIGAEKATLSGPSRVKLCCPYHGDNTPSATIYLDRGYFRCYSLNCCKFIKDPISLTAQFTTRPYLDAFEIFRNSFELANKIKPEDIKVFDAAAVRRRRMALLADCFHAYACTNWNATSLPESASNTITWLKKVRGIGDISTIDSLGMFPKTFDLKKLVIAKGTEEDWEWIAGLLGKYLDIENVDSVVFMYATAPGSYSAFKLRKPLADKKKSIVYIRDENEELGFFGLANAAYAPLIGDPNRSNVAVVEGEFDQISLFQGQCNSGLFDTVFLATGGSGHAGLDGLNALGVDRVSILGDNDEAGEDFPTQLLAKTYHVGCKVFTWPTALNNPVGGKIDPDDAVKIHGFDPIYKAAIDEKNYRLPARWCYDRASLALQNTPGDDVRKQQDIAVKFGALLHDSAELHAFTELVCAEFTLLTPANIFHGVSLDDDTEIGFLARIVEALRRIFHVISMDRETSVLLLWHKTKRTEIKISPGTPAALATLRGFTGPSWTWLKEQVGLPSYFPDIEGEEGIATPLTRTHTTIGQLLEMALFVLAQEAPDTSWEIRGQGLHLQGIDSPDQAGYLVNGDHLFKLLWNEEGDALKDAKELPGPSDGNLIFDLRYKEVLVHRQSKWVPWLETTDDLYRKPTRTLLECYALVYDMLNSICRFRFQTADVTYAALFVFYSYIADSIKRKVLTHIQGEHESGKSTLLSLIAGFSQLSDYSLTYHAHTMDVYTRAGVFTKFHGMRLVIGLDEANDHDDGSRTSMTLQDLLQKLRGLIGGVAKYNMGSKDGGDNNSQYICSPVIMAGATPLHDPMNASRFLSLELVKNSIHKNSRNILNKKFGKKTVESLRDDIFLHMLNTAPKVSRAYEAAWELYGDGTHLPQETDRFVEGLLPLVAVANVIGVDANAFITEFCLTRRDTVNERKATTTGQELFELLLNSPCMDMDVTTGSRLKSLRVALGRSDLRNLINTSSAGIYFDGITKCVAVAWPQARAALLRNTTYARVTDPSLTKIARTCQYYVEPELAQQNGALARLRMAGLAGSTFFTIFNVSYILEEMDAARTEVEMQTALKNNKNTGAVLTLVEKPNESVLPGVNL